MNVSPEQMKAAEKAVWFSGYNWHEFEAWLAAVVRAAQADAWDEATLAEAERIRQVERGFESLRVNPYREGSK